MKLNRLFGPVIVLGLSILAGCGIGVAGSGGGGGGPTPPPGPTITFHGAVYQLAGPLAHTTQSCIVPPTSTPPPSPCPAPAVPPSPSPTAGAPLAGVKIYVTTSSGELITGLPTNPVASTTTASDGTFSATVPVKQFLSGKAGFMAVNGTSISLASGLTDTGFMVAHTEAPLTQVALPPFYLDTVSGDEAAGMAALQLERQKFGLTPVIFDELAQEAIRYGAVNDVPQNPAGCGSQGRTNIFYQALGGFAVSSGYGDAPFPGPSDWSTAMSQIFRGSGGAGGVGSGPKDVFIGVEGPVSAKPCGNASNITTYYNLFVLKS